MSSLKIPVEHVGSDSKCLRDTSGLRKPADENAQVFTALDTLKASDVCDQFMALVAMKRAHGLGGAVSASHV
jgi:hypothetical protein